MSGTILTPGAIWRRFEIPSTPKVTAIDKKKSGSVSYTTIEIEGRKVKGDIVRIHGVFAKGKFSTPAPAILLLRDFESGFDERIQEDLAKKGYIVLAIDIAGKTEDKEFYTRYPEAISYANYQNVKDSLYKIEGDVKDTCWYEWTAVLKYALALLKSREEITTVGCFGIGEAATVAWQLAGTTESLDCACFALNAGWNGYRGIYKFSGSVEPQFSDNMYKFIAGVEPQAYAMHVKCPVLMLTATNSNYYDCDRAYDTVSRIAEAEYRAVHYSVGYRDRVSGEAYQDAVMFFDRFLKTDSYKFNLPKETDIKCDLSDGKILIEVEPDENELKELAVFVSEETVEPCLRAWKKHTEYKKSENGKHLFSYTPYQESGLVTVFAQATYKSGFVMGSNIVSKRFNKEIGFAHKENILYSSRLVGADSLFTAENQAIDNPNHVNIEEKRRVHVKKGPMGIEGVYCEWGLMTFKMNAVKDKPGQDAMLMFDVYAEKDTSFTVKLIADYFGAHTEYLSTVSLKGREVWHNVKITRNRFKTVEGMPLRNYDKVNAVAFNAEDGEYLINNALWV